MSLPLMVGIAVLLAAAEESMSATSITILDCGRIKFQHELHNYSEVPAAIEDTDVTFLIPWLEPTQVKQLGLNDFGTGTFVKKSFGSGHSSETTFGLAYSFGSSQIYVPLEAENSDDFSRLFFEKHILNYSRRFRFIVLSFPEDANLNMSRDSINSFIRLMSLPSDFFEVHLVTVGEQKISTRGFYKADHHRNYVRNIIKSCRECSPISVKRWKLKESEGSKNFPIIPYETSELRTFLQVLKNGNETIENLRTLNCLKMSQIEDSETRNQGDHSRPDSEDNGGLYPHATMVQKDGPIQKNNLVKDELKKFNGRNGMNSKIKNDSLLGFFLQMDHQKYMPLLEALDKLPPAEEAKNAYPRRPGEPPMIVYRPNENCMGDILFITGYSFILEINGKGCPYKTVIAIASFGIHIVSNISLPGKNLILNSEEVITYSDFTIDLTGEKCGRNYSGNFNMFVEKFFGMPLTIITNGGKACDFGNAHDSKESSKSETDFSIKRRFLDSAEEMEVESRSFRGEEKNPVESHRRNSNDKNLLKTIELDSGFYSSLGRRDLIQILAGHIINDQSMDGKKLVRQAETVSNLKWSGDKKISDRLYDPSVETSPFRSPPFLDLADIGNANFRSFRNPGTFNGWCLALEIDNYEIECAIDFGKGRSNELSSDVARTLRSNSVAVEQCYQIDIPYLTEYDLVVCNLTVIELNPERNLNYLNDDLICYYDTINEKKMLSCRKRKDVIDGNRLTDHVIDLARAVLAIRHIIVDPLDMIRVSFTDFQRKNRTQLLSRLHDLYNVTHKFLLHDLDNYYGTLKTKSKLLLAEFFSALGSEENFPPEEEVGNIICWSGFIWSKILGAPPRSNLYPAMFEELVFGTQDTGAFDFIPRHILEDIFLNFDAFVSYLKYIDGKIVHYPEYLKLNLTKITKHYEKIAEDLTEGNSLKQFMLKVDDEDKVKISEELLKTMKDFQNEILKMEEILSGEILLFFQKTIGKFVKNQAQVISIFRAATTLLVREKPWEFLLRFSLEFIYQLSCECKTFQLDLPIEKSFLEAKTNSSLNMNKLYIKILENLELQREALKKLPHLKGFRGEIKVHMEASLDLEREVYKSLQAVARSMDIKELVGKVLAFDGDVESVKGELQNMYDVLYWTLSYLVYKSADIDFQQRIFPFSEDTSPLFHPENITQSLVELSKKEVDYLSNFKCVGFDPKNYSATEKPFFTWHVEDIGEINLHDFFRGRPLYLLARADGEYPIPAKGIKFGLKLIPKKFYPGDWFKQIAKTEVHIRPASFSYNFYGNKTYVASARSYRFIHVIGSDSLGDAEVPVSPYTLWRLRVRKIRVNFPKKWVSRIELIGESLVLDKTPEPPEHLPIWGQNETYDNIYFRLPRPIDVIQDSGLIHP